MFAGSPEADAKLRVRLKPTAETRTRMERRDHLVQEKAARIKADNEARLAAARKLLEDLNPDHTLEEVDQDGREMQAATGAVSAGGGAAAAATTTTTTTTTATAASPPGNSGASISDADGAHPHAKDSRYVGKSSSGDVNVVGDADQMKQTASKAKDMHEIVLTASRCWASLSVSLVPGEYIVFADVEYSVPYEHAFKMTVPAEISEAPWLDGKHPENFQNSRDKKAGKHFTKGETSHPVTASSVMSITDESVAREDEEAEQKKNAALKVTKKEQDLSQLPRMWLHASSVDPVEVDPLRPSQVPPELRACASLADLQHSVPKQCWPFSAEEQGDVASRCLQSLLDRARQDIQVVGLEFMSLAAQYKEHRKRVIQQRAMS